MPGSRGHGQPELRPVAGLAPDLQPAAVQVRVLQRDRQAEAGAAGGAGPRRVGAPEPVEHHARPRRAPVRRRGRGPRSRPRASSAATVHVDRPALAVLDGVGEQVAQHPLDAPGVDLGDARLVRAPGSTRSLPFRSASGSIASTTDSATSRRSVGSVSRTAAPASYRLISSRSASSASNRSSWVCRISALRSIAGSNSARASCRTSAAIRTVVSGVRSSCETSETKRRCTRERSSSWRICRCRLVAICVERRREPGEVVLAAHPHALLEAAGREPLGDPRRHPDGRDDLPGDQPARCRRPAARGRCAASSRARCRTRPRVALSLSSGKTK